MGTHMEGISKVYQPCTLAYTSCQRCKIGISTILLRRFFKLIIKIILFVLILLFLFLEVPYEMIDLATIPKYFLGLSKTLMPPMGFGSTFLSLLSVLIRSSMNNQGLIGEFRSFL
jgi:hypothetical protein